MATFQSQLSDQFGQIQKGRVWPSMRILLTLGAATRASHICQTSAIWPVWADVDQPLGHW